MNLAKFCFYKCLFFVLLAICLFPPHTFGASGSPKSKPQSPFMVSVSREDKNADPPSGDMVGLIITVTSNIDADDMYIDIKVPDDIEVIAGPLNWRGPVGKNESKVLKIKLRAPDMGTSEIKVSAALPSDNGPALSMVATFELGKSEDRKLVIKSPSVKGGRGRGIIERIIKK